MAGIDSARGLGDGDRKRLQQVPAGAIMLFKKNLTGDSADLKRLTTELNAVIAAALPDELPPFIACDQEGGIVNRITFPGARLPPPASYAYIKEKYGKSLALQSLYLDAAASARALRELGINLNLAPVAEVLSDENAHFLEERAYGRDADFVTEAAAVFCRAMAQNGVACVLKHFPGNGADDPHFGLPVIAGDEDALARMTAPFAALIARNRAPAFIMVSHAVVAAWDNGRNASLSPLVMRTVLRERLGFAGVILADDFSMGATSGMRAEDAAVLSLAAGADMVMAWPATLLSTHSAILDALKTGRLARAALEDSAARIIAAK
jgi:beta-N-acetylhexosaminidase